MFDVHNEIVVGKNEHIIKLQTEVRELKYQLGATIQTKDKYVEMVKKKDQQLKNRDVEIEHLTDKIEAYEENAGTATYWERQCLRLENEKANLHKIVNDLEEQSAKSSEVTAKLLEGRDMTAGKQADYIAKLQRKIRNIEDGFHDMGYIPDPDRIEQ